jgi:anti-sigma B factor antagonist
MAILHTRVHGGQVMVALPGELDTTGATRAAAAVADSASLGQPVIVDLAGLDYIDCAALGALVGARQLARRDGGDVLAAPHGLVLRLLALTGLDQVFGVYPSVTAASATRPPASTVDAGLAAADAAAGY